MARGEARGLGTRRVEEDLIRHIPLAAPPKY
jgi:hypothetical protein